MLVLVGIAFFIVMFITGNSIEKTLKSIEKTSKSIENQNEVLISLLEKNKEKNAW